MAMSHPNHGLWSINMPIGPKGQKHPADVVGSAIMVAKIATGEIEGFAPDDGKNKAARE